MYLYVLELTGIFKLALTSVFVCYIYVQTESVIEMVIYFMHWDSKHQKIFICHFFFLFFNSKEKMEEVFKSADEDGSGTLSCDEIVPVLAEHLGLEPMFVYGMAEEFDANKDGQLDKKEFSNLFLAYYM